MPTVLGLYRSRARLPKGRTVFSVVFARKAAYFRTIRPRFRDVRPHRAELVVADRKRVRNHIGTVPVIAICNGLEAAMGALAEAAVPAGKRWIPKGMRVEYAGKATSDIVCVAQTEPADWSTDPTYPCGSPRLATTAAWSSPASSTSG
ncbi:MAG: DUF4442 domain-containing protein [Nocardioidaceae bacterium]